MTHLLPSSSFLLLAFPGRRELGPDFTVPLAWYSKAPPQLVATAITVLSPFEPPDPFTLQSTCRCSLPQQ